MLAGLLIGVGVMCLLTAVLTVLMLVAEAWIADYGEATITLNGERRLTVPAGRPLLASLKDHQVFIPSACGGRGSCGLCKLVVEDPVSEPLPTEIPWLNAQERKAGVRLACQFKVRKDLRIRIPEALLSVRQYATEVVSLRDLTYDIKEVRLRLIEPPAIDFVAGQFVQFEVPPYALTEAPVYRAYSIASDPAGKDGIELEIRYVPNGICTTYVHKHLKVGDRVTVNGPYGEFRRQPTGREMICIAGGSGMAPVKSMLLEMERLGDPRKVTYYFGARSRRDLFLVERMRQIEKTLPNFRFVPALSEPQPADAWTGETGLITHVVDRQVADASQMEAYLCGSPLMIDACVELLTKKKGMPPGNVFYDKFA